MLHFSVHLGECADELFGGYRWFYDNKETDTFPWIHNLEYRQSLINKDLNIDIISYVKDKYKECISKAPILETDNKEMIKERQMSYLNHNYFMANLLERKDRMTMGASLEVRVPFADKRIVELTYSIPFKYKYKDNQEKKLLRDAFKDLLPSEVLNRKKSPYPKPRNKDFDLIVINLYKECIKNKDSILYKLFDHDRLNELIDIEELDEPWYGQLMRKTELLAYLYQIDYWAKEYNVKLDL